MASVYKKIRRGDINEQRGVWRNRQTYIYNNIRHIVLLLARNRYDFRRRFRQSTSILVSYHNDVSVLNSPTPHASAPIKTTKSTENMRFKLLDGIYCALSYIMYGGHPRLLIDKARDLLGTIFLLALTYIAIFLGAILKMLPLVPTMICGFLLGLILNIPWYFYIKKNRDRIFEESDRYNTKGYRILSISFIAFVVCAPFIFCLIDKYILN